jgi:hypothetical protein
MLLMYIAGMMATGNRTTQDMSVQAHAMLIFQSQCQNTTRRY